MLMLPAWRIQPCLLAGTADEVSSSISAEDVGGSN
jgi:hypothetical protein